MALSRPIGWLRDQRGDAVGLATADPLFQGGETKPTGYVATYSPVFTAEQVQQEIKEQAVSAWRAAGFEPMLQVFVAHAIETEVRKQDDELILQLVEALENSHATLWEEDDDPERPAHAAIAAGRARLEGKP